MSTNTRNTTLVPLSIITSAADIPAWLWGVLDAECQRPDLATDRFTRDGDIAEYREGYEGTLATQRAAAAVDGSIYNPHKIAFADGIRDYTDGLPCGTFRHYSDPALEAAYIEGYQTAITDSTGPLCLKLAA